MDISGGDAASGAAQRRLHGRGHFARQYIYINPAAHLVIVLWSAWPGAWVDANAEEAATFFGGVVKALKASRPHLARSPASGSPAVAGRSAP